MDEEGEESPHNPEMIRDDSTAFRENAESTLSLSEKSGMMRLGFLFFSLSFLIWSLSYTLWPALFTEGGLYQVTPLFGADVYFHNFSFLAGIVLSMILTGVGMVCVATWGRGRTYKGKLLLSLSFLAFTFFAAIQAVGVLYQGFPLGAYIGVISTSPVVIRGIIIESAGIFLYLILFTIPVMVLGNNYARIIGAVAAAISVWIYLETYESLFFLFTHGNTGYHYFGYLPFSPYFGGLTGLLINYKIPPYASFYGTYLYQNYLLISGLLFFLAYLLVFLGMYSKTRVLHD